MSAGARATIGLATLLGVMAIGCASPPDPAEDAEPGRTVLLSEESGDGARAEPARRRPPVLSSEQEDRRIGEQQSRVVQAEIGLISDATLNEYVTELGERLARYAPDRGYDYHFFIVDEFEPNAFALPGGFIYLSRGVLALANSEDELANVVAHEITHAARRHAAARQEVQRRQNPFVMPQLQFARMAAYTRDLERDADRGAQTIAARAGYDPMGMVTFLQSLGDIERLRMGHAPIPTFFDTHPGTNERAATSAARASQIRWERTPEAATGRADYLRRIDGLVLGENPIEGVFQGSRFLHPDLDFHVRFPTGWELVNTHRAVGAESRERGARIFLVAEGGEKDPERAARALVERSRRDFRVHVIDATPLRIGEIDAYQIEAEGFVEGRMLAALITFIPHRGLMYRIVGVAPRPLAQRVLPFAHATARSFRPLTDEERDSVTVLRLRAVEASGGEDVVALSERTGNAWDPTRTGILNGVPASTRFAAGDLVKIVVEEPYLPERKPEPSDDAPARRPSPSDD